VRKRRRTKYTWLPTIGTDLDITGAPDDVVAGQQITTVALDTGETSIDIFPLTVDQPLEGTSLLNNTTLGTVIGNEYVLKRIVGKWHAAMQPKRLANNDPSNWGAVMVCVGIFVARAQDADQNADQPIGSATIGERRQNYSPLHTDCIREPWVWRRTWVLTNPAFANTQEALTAGTTLGSTGIGYPTSTGLYGSVADGPHIDAKTVRRVKQDERLWVAIATLGFPLGGAVDQSSTVVHYFDFRLLGALRRARNSGAF